MGLGLGLPVVLAAPRLTLRQVADLNFWIDASGIAAQSGITTVPDLSGKGHDASGGVGTGATKPDVTANVQNNRNALSFATSQNLDIQTAPFGAAYSVIWAGSASSAAASYMFCDQSGLTALISRFTSTALEWFGDATERATINAAPGTTWHIWQIDHTDGGSYVLWEDNVQVATGSSNRTDAAQFLAKIGSTNAATPGSYATCKLGEFAISAAVLTTAQRREASALLKLKWGTP